MIAVVKSATSLKVESITYCESECKSVPQSNIFKRTVAHAIAL